MFFYIVIALITLLFYIKPNVRQQTCKILFDSVLVLCSYVWLYSRKLLRAAPDVISQQPSSSHPHNHDSSIEPSFANNHDPSFSTPTKTNNSSSSSNHDNSLNEKSHFHTPVSRGNGNANSNSSASHPKSSSEFSPFFSENVPISLKPLEPGDEKWEADSAAQVCGSCVRVFTLWVRRHHCRFCGQVFCHKCTNSRVKGYRACAPCVKLVSIYLFICNIRIHYSYKQHIYIYIIYTNTMFLLCLSLSLSHVMCLYVSLCVVFIWLCRVYSGDS